MEASTSTRNSGIGVVAWLRAGGIVVRLPDRDNRLISYPETSRPALRSTQRPIQWVPGILLGGKAAGA